MNRPRICAALFIAAAMALCGYCQPSYGAWQLDPVFGDGGVFTHDNAAGGSRIDLASDIAIQSDGKIVLVGRSESLEDLDLAVWRLDNDGTLDPSFGTDGVVVHGNAAGGGRFDWGNAVAIQSDGKLVVVGESEGLAEDGSLLTEGTVWRFNTDGTLDDTFGSGGIVLCRQVLPVIGLSKWAECNAVALQTDGKIIVAGQVPWTGTAFAQFGVFRLNEDGSPDRTFASEGFFLYPARYGGMACDAAVREDGTIVACGMAFDKGPCGIVAIRLEEDGSLDDEFGAGGVFSLDPAYEGNFVSRLAVQGDGKVVICGDKWVPYSGTILAAWRLNWDGAIDGSFAEKGMFSWSSGRYVEEDDLASAGDICLIPWGDDEKIVIAGCDQNEGRVFDLAVLRLNPDGTLDPDFFEGGVFLHADRAEGSGSEGASGITAQADGKIVAAGNTCGPDVKFPDCAAWRLMGDEVPPEPPLLRVVVSDAIASAGDLFVIGVEISGFPDYRIDGYAVITAPGGTKYSIRKMNRLTKGDVVPIVRGFVGPSTPCSYTLLQARVPASAPRGTYTVTAGIVPEGTQVKRGGASPMMDSATFRIE